MEGEMEFHNMGAPNVSIRQLGNHDGMKSSMKDVAASIYFDALRGEENNIPENQVDNSKDHILEKFHNDNDRGSPAFSAH